LAEFIELTIKMWQAEINPYQQGRC
jgi:hypothetical protein